MPFIIVNISIRSPLHCPFYNEKESSPSPIPESWVHHIHPAKDICSSFSSSSSSYLAFIMGDIWWHWSSTLPSHSSVSQLSPPYWYPSSHNHPISNMGVKSSHLFYSDNRSTLFAFSLLQPHQVSSSLQLAFYQSPHEAYLLPISSLSSYILLSTLFTPTILLTQLFSHTCSLFCCLCPCHHHQTDKVRWCCTRHQNIPFQFPWYFSVCNNPSTLMHTCIFFIISSFLCCCYIPSNFMSLNRIVLCCIYQIPFHVAQGLL